MQPVASVRNVTPVTRGTGRIVYCFGVIDEADIIEHFLEYHLSIGVDAFVASDVGSTDGTLDILSRYERAGCLHLIRVQDAESEWAIPMIDAAQQRYQAEWCLFGDPDEFWIFPEVHARAYFASAPAGIVIFPRYNMVPSRQTADGSVAHFSEFDLVVSKPLDFFYHQPRNFLQDFQLRREQRAFATVLLISHPPEILRVIGPKVAARPELIGSLIPGFHDVVSIPPEAPRHKERSGYIAHFPIRSAEQLRRKAALVARHYNRTQEDPVDGWHWARLSVLFKHELIEQEFSRQVLEPEEIALRLSEGILRRDTTASRALTRLSKLPRIIR
jgi:hypothetical protein